MNSTIKPKTVAWMRGRHKKLAMRGYFIPLDGEDAYQQAMLEVVKCAGSLPRLEGAKAATYLAGVFSRSLNSYHKYRVLPARTEYRRAEEKILATEHELAADGDPVEAGRTSLRDAGEQLRAMPDAEMRRLAARKAIGEILRLAGDREMERAFIAYIMADGNLFAAAGIARMSKSRFYRLWPGWLAKARAVAEKTERKGV